MTIRATVDRFEGDLVVLLVGEEGTPVNVPRSDLPGDVRQGDVLRLEVVVDRESTEGVRESIQEKIERLKRRGEDV